MFHPCVPQPRIGSASPDSPALALTRRPLRFVVLVYSDMLGGVSMREQELMRIERVTRNWKAEKERRRGEGELEGEKRRVMVRKWGVWVG